METLWHMLMALAAAVAPLLTAWWLLARGAKRQAGKHRHRAGLPARTPARGSDTIEP